jgi:type VI secretion system FHA domain protein
MILTLEVMGGQAEDLGAGSRKVFDSIGGTIGRLPDNDWVFPDPYVSGRHALIRYLNGTFFVEDTSTNGVFINSLDHRVSRAQAHPLKDGDVLYIDAFRIQVSIQKPAGVRKRDNDPFELLNARARDARHDKTVAMTAGERNDHTENMIRSDESPVEWVGGIDIDAVSLDPTVAQEPKKAAKRLPPVPTRAVPPAPSEAPPRKRLDAAPDSDALLRQLIQAAGIEGVEPSVELAQTLGSVLRVAVDGLMEVLRARERVKGDIRVRGTTFKPQDNNPLKFSANVDDAFHNLLVKRNAAYLTPADAVDDALRDVRDHQAAIVAATRVAFESMLAQFDPTHLQDEFDRQIKKSSILGAPAKLRYWDLYREKYGAMLKDADATFRAIFGDAFATAYEENVERLQALARKRPK